MTLAKPIVVPDFCEGLRGYAGEPVPAEHEPAIAAGRTAIEPGDPRAVRQTLLAADALRYLTLQMTASKASGHPGGAASVAEAVAALIMLGHKHLVTGVGHHAPGVYAALFLDRSLEAMDIHDVRHLCHRFREYGGLLGHLSGRIPGVVNPAGPLGQAQHIATAAALLHRETLFPLLLGDGGFGEPYVMSSLLHFHTAYPGVTNFLPVLAWNGFSQEHHSMVSAMSNADMVDYWRGHRFDEVLVVDAKDFDDRHQPGEFADSTRCSLAQRLAFTEAVLRTVDAAARAARSGRLTVLVVKQLKGAGMHARGARAHNLSAEHTLDHPQIADTLNARALHPAAWQVVRTNFERAGGGPAAKILLTESDLPRRDIGRLPVEEFPVNGEPRVPTTAIGRLMTHVGRRDADFVVTNADGNEACGLGGVNQALRVLHPTEDAQYNQGRFGQVYEPVNEDACAGLAAALSLMGGRAVWCSYESFAVNGLPIWQTVTQAMAELCHQTPSAIALFTAGALDQGRNGWTHQRPEIEAYLAALMRNGNVFPLFPPDANSAQQCYEWALDTRNKGIVITAGKSPLPIRLSLEQSRRGLQEGGCVLQESPGSRTVVFAVIGDTVLDPVFEAAGHLRARGVGSRIVSVISPRRLYRPGDVAWEACSEPDGLFLDDDGFARMFGGDALLGVSGGASAPLEPILLRSTARRDVFAWKRGETMASGRQLMALNNLQADAFVSRALALIG